MKGNTSRISLAAAFFTLVLAGCATTQVTSSPVDFGGRKIPRPDQIVVYPFAATTADLAPEERAGGYGEPSAPPSAKELSVARELGVKVAERLVDEINEMGMHAVVGGGGTAPHVGDIVIEGHFESVEEGSAGARWVVGFGAGKAELRTVVAAYRMSNNGFLKVGGGTVDSAGGKGPGLFIPVIVTAATANPVGLIVAGAAKAEGQISGRTTIDGAAKRTADAIAERMKERMQQEGWI